MQLEVKTILNRIQHFVGFVYQSVRLRGRVAPWIEVRVEPHQGIHRRCSQCLKPCPGYDVMEQRSWRFVPLWQVPVWFSYAPRRVICGTHGVVVEYLPWSEGKRPLTKAMMGFLAGWARRLSWRVTARSFGVSWKRFIVRSNGACTGAWRTASSKGSAPLASTRFTGAMAKGRTAS